MIYSIMNDLFNKVYIPNKTRFKSKHVQHDQRYKWIKNITKHISCKCKSRFDGKNVIQINVGIAINVDVSVKKFMYVNKNYIWNPATCNCGNGKYLASIMDDSAIVCEEVMK